METNKESSFVREIESRLNILFGEDADKPDAKKDIEAKDGRDQLEEVALEPEAETEYKATEPADSGSEPLHVHDSLKEVSVEPEAVPGPSDAEKKDYFADDTAKPTEGNEFVREIEDRLSTLFSTGDRTEQPEPVSLGEAKLQEIVSAPEAQIEEDRQEGRFEELYGDVDATSSIMYSPLRELKGIVLSIEWEISEAILEKFEQEVDHLYELYSEDRIVLGFLQILRFLGRFIREKEADADAGSISLLLFIYDDLESVVLSNTLTVEAKKAILAEDIKKYKSWVETADLAIKKREPAKVKPETAEPKRGDEWQAGIQEPLLPSQMGTADTGQAAQLAANESDTLAKIKDLTPHEIIAYALDELRKTIVAEFSALRADLKQWRQEP
jgi:hypothetical protein